MLLQSRGIGMQSFFHTLNLNSWTLSDEWELNIRINSLVSDQNNEVYILNGQEELKVVHPNTKKLIIKPKLPYTSFRDPSFRRQNHLAMDPIHRRLLLVENSDIRVINVEIVDLDNPAVVLKKDIACHGAYGNHVLALYGTELFVQIGSNCFLVFDLEDDGAMRRQYDFSGNEVRGLQIDHNNRQTYVQTNMNVLVFDWQ